MAKVSPHASNVATAASIIGMVQSLVVIVATAILISQYSNCSPDNNLSSKRYFFKLLKIQYFQDPNCEVTTTQTVENLLTPNHVLIWLIINLTVSSVWFIVSCMLKIVSFEGAYSYFPVVAFSWSACAIAVFVVDVTLAILFAMDFAALNNLLGRMDLWDFDQSIYRVDLLRIGTFFILTFSLKGLVLEMLNIRYVISLIILGVEILSVKDTSHVHPTITLGPLQAFDGGHLNNSFRNDNSSIHSSFENTGFNGRPDETSDSWHHSRSPDLSSSRPFSYIEYSRQRSALPPAPASSPAVMPPWQRDPWTTEPAPDYSPVVNKKLKSALKR